MTDARTKFCRQCFWTISPPDAINQYHYQVTCVMIPIPQPTSALRGLNVIVSSLLLGAYQIGRGKKGNTCRLAGGLNQASFPRCAAPWRG
ncbi:hypothetical protein SBV1_370014 [Verrucomicrobia bacterium]|nr:hypothetical protein SBV1_370014 [Verrucomicrobiota bacterium]